MHGVTFAAFRTRRAQQQARRRAAYTVVLVALLHIVALYYLSASTVAVQLTQAKSASSVIRVSLVAAPAVPSAPSAVTPPVQPATPSPPVVKPLPKHLTPKPVLATHHVAPRTVAQDETPTPPVQPPVAEQQLKAAPATPSAVVPSASPAPPDAAPSTTPPGAPAIGKMMALPKTLDSAALKQLGCRIPQPDFPPSARRLGETGTVRLLINIGTDGKFSTVKLLHSSGYSDLDAAALQAISQGSCSPYLQDGTPVSVTAVQPITFNLDN